MRRVKRDGGFFFPPGESLLKFLAKKQFKKTKMVTLGGGVKKILNFILSNFRS
jgi:hypothetical protein